MGSRRPSREGIEYMERCKANQRRIEEMPSENLLIVNAVCQEVSRYPVFTLCIDLDKAHDGNVTVTVDRDFLIAVGELACEN